ncbi:MAG: Bifunctional uridylyltransferase/uridylyl-removing enzyme [Thermoanaerobaculia bacterium]|nr:Bifunctional uridylyltransferase/uridylyl-removing enzyme [Thermoanaerobaculia bacterium]
MPGTLLRGIRSFLAVEMRDNITQLRFLGNGRKRGLDRAEPLSESGMPVHVEAVRRHLETETLHLRKRHRAGLGGLQTCSERTLQIDLVVKRLCGLASSETGTDRDRVAIVATGGYGRNELAPFSSVGLTFIHEGGGADLLGPIVERATGLLAKTGLASVQNQVSLRECLRRVREDFRFRTALTEARFLMGKRDLFDAVQKDIDARLLWDRRQTEEFLERIRTEIAERHARCGGAVAIQEPDVKEGVGGLRDLHAILWVGHARFGSRGLAALHSEGSLSASEHHAARLSLDFLSRVRNELHFLSGRKNDRLSLDLQEEVAANLGYGARGGRLASEVFMRDYYRRASELSELRRGFLLRHLESFGRANPSPTRRRPIDGGFEIREGQLFRSLPETSGGARHLLDAFAISQAEKVPLSDDLHHMIQARLHLVGQKVRESPPTGAAFLKLFDRRGRVGPAVRAMHETGYLGRLLPEWECVTFLVEHDDVHRYTVDEHALRAVEALDALAAGEARAALPFGRVLDDIPDVRPLYLGTLLHVIGKVRGVGHAEEGARLARQITSRLGIEEKTAGDIHFLVRRHLDMSRTSQRRDLSEPSLIASFAARAGSLERLDMLLLLSYADMCAIAPGAFSEWKGALLLDLYRRARAHLTGSATEEGASDRARAGAVEALRDEFPPAAIERHFSMLTERYLRANGTDRMVRHFRLASRRLEAPAAVEWHDLEGGRGTEMALTAGDHPGLFAKVAGTLTANGIDILAVDLFVREDGVVLDTFTLSENPGHGPVSLERREKIARDLGEVVAGKRSVDELMASWSASASREGRRLMGRASRPPSVRFDNETSTAATVIDVRAADRPGLAFGIAGTLARLGLNITFAKIATDGAQALDVFYVTEAGGKLTPERLPDVERALLDALAPKPEPNPRKRRAGR